MARRVPSSRLLPHSLDFDNTLIKAPSHGAGDRLGYQDHVGIVVVQFAGETENNRRSFLPRSGFVHRGNGGRRI
jgi:hypothetical protein